jgi:3-dehydroquinate synthase
MKTKIIQAKIEELNQYLEQLPTDLLLLVVDSNIWQLFRGSLNFQFKNKKVISYSAIPGEDSKTFKEYEKCLEFFLSRGIHRQAHVVAIGGGAVSDMAGFVAATLLRGLPWHVAPTSLLSMVDAAIGGKVAINSQQGKNLIGAFHAPEQVFICQEFLKMLPKDEHWSGVGEVLKYGMLDANIFAQIEKSPAIDLDLLMICAQYKFKITAEDFKEKGLRKILNLGHTVGHALEWHYRLTHGEAVLWGMLTELLVLDCQDSVNAIKNLARKMQWPRLESPWFQKKIPIEALAEIMAKDKKMQNDQQIDLIKIETPGKHIITRMNFEKFVELLREHELNLRTLAI